MAQNPRVGDPAAADPAALFPADPDGFPDGHTRTTWYFPWQHGAVREEVVDAARFRGVVLPPVRMGDPNPCGVENGKVG